MAQRTDHTQEQTARGEFPGAGARLLSDRAGETAGPRPVPGRSSHDWQRAFRDVRRFTHRTRCDREPVAVRRLVATLALLGVLALDGVGCGKQAGTPGTRGEDPQVQSRGTTEITAELVEIPEGAIFKRELYNYATILQYKVLRQHRGKVSGDTIYVAHYNPFKPRGEAADARVKGVGGNLKQFRAHALHRMALEVPLDDFYMGGVVNKYFGKTTGPIYWAVWTNDASE